MIRRERPIAACKRLLAFWPEEAYGLISLSDAAGPVVRAFRIEDGVVTEDPIEQTIG